MRQAASSCQTFGLPRVDQALEVLRGCFDPVAQTEKIPLCKATKRILAHDAVAQISMPPHDRSAMDGYAFHSSSVSPLRLVGRSLAGNPFAHIVGKGECVAIATGAALAAGCDTVAMREHCRQTPQGVFAEAPSGQHVRRQGEDFCAGDILIPAGTRLDARHIALLASGGVTQVAVRRPLRVALFSIGDELRNSGTGIFDANRAMLSAMCAEWGIEVHDFGILPDRREIISATLARAAMQNDVVIGSAGTSVGDEDHARNAILDCGGEILIRGVAIKPGKPITFGRIGRALHIALPGNPVAAFVTFVTMGLPTLDHLMGAKQSKAPWHNARATFAHRKKQGMREYLRVTLHLRSDGAIEATKTDKNGSAMLTSLAGSDGLVCLGEVVTDIAPGMPVAYRTFAELMAP